MKIEDFKKLYRLNNYTSNESNDIIVYTEVIRRKDNHVVDNVRSTLDYNNTDSWIRDSQHPISITPWDWGKLLEQTKKYQFDYFVLKYSIEDYFPLDSSSNLNIEDYYT